MVQKKMSSPNSLVAPPHVFQKQNSCPQLLVSEHPSIQQLLDTGVLDKDQLMMNVEEGQWRMAGAEANKDRKAPWK